MAGTLDSLSVRWKIRLPNEGCAISSPRFRFRGTEYDMEIRRLCPGGDILLHLCRVDQSLPPPYPFSVSVRLEGSETVPSELGQIGNYDVEHPLIWCREFEDVCRTHPELGLNPLLTFVVTFEEMDDTRGENSVSDAAGAAVQPSSPTCPCPEVHSKTFASVSVQTASATSCQESLVEDFSELLDADSDPDVKLRCEGHTAMAHKKVLSARSPVFASMLQSDMVEGKTGVVNIRDMDADTFRRFLRYAYTGKLDELAVDSATSLYEAGDMYGMKSLAKGCSDFLIENLTVENVCDALVLADTHSDAEFVEAVTAYILEQKLPQWGGRWRAFCKSHPVLSDQVMNRYLEGLGGPGGSKQ